MGLEPDSLDFEVRIPVKTWLYWLAIFGMAFHECVHFWRRVLKDPGAATGPAGGDRCQDGCGLGVARRRDVPFRADRRRFTRRDAPGAQRSLHSPNPTIIIWNEASVKDHEDWTLNTSQGVVRLIELLEEIVENMKALRV